MKGKSLSPVRLLATPWTTAYQASPSIGFSRQEYWSGVPLPSPAEFCSFLPSYYKCPLAVFSQSTSLARIIWGFPAGKESSCNARDPDSSLGWGRSPGGGHGNPLQRSCLENLMERGGWRATYSPWVEKSQTPLKWFATQALG